MFKKIAGLSLALCGALYSSVALAAADPDVTDAATSIASTTKENIMSVITTNAPTVVLVGVAIFGIFLVWKMLKRFAGR